MLPDRLAWPALITIAFFGPASAAESDPTAAATAVVEELHAALLQASEDDTSSVEQRVELLTPVVKKCHDLDYMSKFVLRRHLNELSAAEVGEFQRLFERLSITSYASRFTNLPEGSLTTTGSEQLRADRVQVDTELRLDDGRIVTLSYTLQNSGGDWRIINVVADGVSDLALRRAEYSSIIRKKGFAALLDHISAQIAALG